jgi:hypothetical protein
MYFQSSVWLKLIVFILLLNCACSGYQDQKNEDGNDLSLSPSKIEYLGKSIEPVSITSTMLYMGCCTGFELQLHLEDKIGFDIKVRFLFEGGWFEPGEYDLTSESNPMVWICHENDDCQPTRGNLIAAQEEAYKDPIYFTLNAQIDEEGIFQGLKLWIDRFPVIGFDWTDRLAIYLLADESITAVQAAQLPLDSLEIASSPLMTMESLAYYDANTHALFFGSWWSSGSLINPLPQVGVFGLPFVVVADQERIYLGAFYTLISSVLFDGPIIVIDYPEAPYDHVVIEPNYASPQTPDPRSDTRIFNVLRASGKLKE